MVTVYVDEPTDWGKGTVKGAPRVRYWSHLMADSLWELHAMAESLGLRRSWFQGPPKHRLPHYDITREKRALALTLGAKPIPTETKEDDEWFLMFLRKIAAESSVKKDKP